MRKTALARTPAVLLGQLGRTSFSNCIIAGQLPEAPTFIDFLYSGSFHLAV